MGTRSTNLAQSFYDNFFRSGTDAASEYIPIPMSASGGTEVESGGYRIHIFTASSTPGFNVTTLGPGEIEVLVVAGGGAGGGGGGGAGGLRNLPYTLSVTGAYPITVGGGGSPGGTEQPTVDAGDGAPSYISGPGGAIVFATGGGGGGMHDHAPNIGQTGGSGGGRAAIATGIEPGSATVASPDGISPTVQGNPGGGAYNYIGGNGTSAGGGGAGGAGGNGTPPANGTPRVAGLGGEGLAIPWMPPSYGTSGPTPGRWFAGGGGGAGWSNEGADGGSGGGGSGGYNPGVTPTSSGQAGTVNTGGGGGATSYPPYGTGGTGGSGIVAIRYQI